MANPILSPVRFCPKCQCDTERYAKGDCKPCSKARDAVWKARNVERRAAIDVIWRAANLDKISASGAAWRAANKGRKAATDAAYRAANPEKVRAWGASNPARRKSAQAARYAANPDKVKAANAAWHAANPGARLIITQNRRARKRESGGILTKGLAAKLIKLQRGKCACCALPLGDDYHLDHIMPLALGGSNTDDNIQLLRAICNQQKSAKHPVDFMRQRGFLL